MALPNNLDEKRINTVAPKRRLLPPAGKQKEYSIAAACIFESAKSQIMLRSYEHSRKAPSQYTDPLFERFWRWAGGL